MAKYTGALRTQSRAKLYEQLDELYADPHSDNIAAAAGSATSTTNAGESVPLRDSTGAIIGYLAVYGDANLTTA